MTGNPAMKEKRRGEEEEKKKRKTDMRHLHRRFPTARIFFPCIFLAMVFFISPDSSERKEEGRKEKKTKKSDLIGDTFTGGSLHLLLSDIFSSDFISVLRHLLFTKSWVQKDPIGARCRGVWKETNKRGKFGTSEKLVLFKS
ncbi:unnamed protein product [Cuscuta epithymum]|uniref:Uncharacterized protein n=1 Tax=Cuscuta epithymum TaxID=186058 RepID=A0AAV0DUW2_9ASTE|nr:unnamed protein product [Cuscuta epithymum]